MSRVDRRIDGITVDNWEARFAGRIPLENEEIEAATVDNTVVLVIVAHQDGMSVNVNKKTGDLTRTNVMKVTDARLVDGELRSVLVEKLGLYGSDTVEIPMKTPVHEGQQELPFDADQETGEVYIGGNSEATVTWTDTADDTVEGTVEVLGKIGEGRPEGQGRPGVARFDAAAAFGGPPTGQMVGHINAHRDPALAGFLDEV